MGVLGLSGIVPFAAATSYEIVYCSLQAPRFIFLNSIPGPDVGCFPCVGSLDHSREIHPDGGSMTKFSRLRFVLTSVTLLFPLSFFFGALPLPFRRGPS